MLLVINEWFLEFLIPVATGEDQARLQAFFNKLNNTSSKIVIGRETPFTQKFYKYSKKYQYDHEFKKKAKKVFNLLFRDSTRTIIVEKEAMKCLPPIELVSIHNDDWYLIHLANTVPESVIVSTDSRLIKALSKNKIARIVHLDKYLQDLPT